MAERDSSIVAGDEANAIGESARVSASLLGALTLGYFWKLSPASPESGSGLPLWPDYVQSPSIVWKQGHFCSFLYPIQSDFIRDR
jgi:hypothetical protein